jgi:transposase, IS30 family
MGERYRHLCAEERGVIMALTALDASVRSIARVLGRSPSTITRERLRNGYHGAWKPGVMGRPPIAGGYYAQLAEQRARRLRRKRRCERKLRVGGALWPWVRALLKVRWSPEQITGTLRRMFPNEPAMHVSHETIYTAIYAMPRGALRKECVALLRQGRGARRPRSRGNGRRGQLREMLSIHLRPVAADERLVPGHWEGDFIKGTRGKAAVGTLVDRRTLFCILAKMDGSTAQDALEGFTRAFAPLAPDQRQTLTYDQGKEMALHKRLSVRTGLRIYFADPHSPWQRGVNENTNGLLRQYLPKGCDLSQFSQDELDAIAWQLNNRPRKSLNFYSPAEIFPQALTACCT